MLTYERIRVKLPIHDLRDSRCPKRHKNKNPIKKIIFKKSKRLLIVKIHNFCSRWFGYCKIITQRTSFNNKNSRKS